MKKKTAKNVPLTVEIVGAIEKVQQVLGMPKTKPYKLSSYAEASAIINQINNLGFTDTNYKLSGFINDGVKPVMLNKVRYIKALGGKSEFKALVEDANEISAKLYLDTSVQSVHRSGITKGFSKYSDSARFVSDELCELYEFSPLWYGKLKDEDSYFLLKPKLIDEASDVLIDFSKKYGLKGISYRDNGYLLASDFNDRNIVSRAKSKQMQVEKMNKVQEEGLGIIVNYGNDYSLKNVDVVTNMPLHGNSYALIDRMVPFYQIALHGYVDYAGKALNLSFDQEQTLLESAESGSGLFFTFTNADETALQDTKYTEYYSADFNAWKNRFQSIYTEYNKEMSKVYNSLISDHSYISEQVTKTSYENGYSVLVNFGYTDFVMDSGVVVPARYYKVLKVEE